MKKLAFTAKGQVLTGQPLAVLKLSNRAKNVLQRGKIYTVDELVENWGRIGTIRGCGLQTVWEIRAEFFAWYMEQIDGTPDWPTFINSMTAVEV